MMIMNQSYAFILEQTARSVFEVLGITFYGKNYAMGGIRSGPEISLCMSAVYGPELDILTYDFALTDGARAFDLYDIWSQRAGVHPTFPTIIAYGSISADRTHERLEKAGMSTFSAAFTSERSGNFLAGKFPDSDDAKVNVDGH